MHGQHPSAAVDHPLHLHQTELVQPVRPDIHRVSVLHKYRGQALVEGSRSRHVLDSLVILNYVHIGADCALQREVHDLTNTHRARTSYRTYESGVDAQLAHQAHCCLESRSSSPFLTLVPGYYVGVCSEGVDCFE